MARWEVDLYTEGSFVGTVKPMDLEFDLIYKEPHIVNFDISLADEIVSRDFIGPYRSDFRLRRIDQAIVGGMITSLHLEDENDVIGVGCKSWMHYLERRIFPYDPTGLELEQRGALVYVNKDPVNIARDILVYIRDYSPYSFCLDYSIIVTGTTGKSITVIIPPGDTTTVFDKIKTLSEANQAGFDFDIEPSKLINIYAVEKYSPYLPVFAFTRQNGGLNAVSWTNNGPSGTHLAAVGGGQWLRQYVNRHYRANSELYRRLDDTFDVGEILDRKALNSLVAGQAAWGSNPVYDITIDVQTSEIDNFWQIFEPGVYVTVDFDFYPFHRLFSIYKVTQIHAQISNEGEELATLTLEKWFSVSDDDGYPDP